MRVMATVELYGLNDPHLIGRARLGIAPSELVAYAL